MRTFVAIDLTPDLKITIEALIRNVKKGAKSIKWTNSAEMHLTLKFLGDIPPLLPTGVTYDVAEAGALVGQRLIAKLQGDPWRGADGVGIS